MGAGPSSGEELEAKIARYRRELARANRRISFPHVYVVVAIPTSLAFLLLALLPGRLLDLTDAVAGALFFSLLITCVYLVAIQPGQEELISELEGRLKHLIREKARLESGRRGEQEVAYVLQWLPKEYIVFNNIRLVSPTYGSQQFDHLVIGPNGIFHLETKNIKGAVVISPQGDWTVIRQSRDTLIREGMASPLGQLERHETVLREVISGCCPKQPLPIVGVVVLSHPKVILEGNDPRLTVLKKEQLNTFIRSYNSRQRLSAKEVRRIALGIARAIEVKEEPKEGDVADLGDNY